MNLYNIGIIVLLFVVIASIFLATIVLKKSLKNNIRHGFWASFFIFFTALWGISNLILVTFIKEEDSAIFLGKIIFCFACFVSYTFLSFCFSYSKNNSKKYSLFFIILFIPTLLQLFFIIFTENIIKDALILDWGVDPVYGKFYFLFLIYFLLYIIFGFLILLFFYFKTKDHVKKIQSKYLLFGLFLSTIFGTFSNLIYPAITDESRLSRFGPIAAIFIVVFMSYAITRYRFMDIKVMIRKSVLYVLFLILGTTLILGFVTVFYFILIYLKIPVEVAYLFVTALLILFLPALKNYLKEFFEKYFNEDIIDLSVVDKFATSISQAKELNVLIKDTDDFIKKKLKAQKIEFLVHDFRVPELRYICQYPEDKVKSFGTLEGVREYFLKERVLALEELPYIKNNIEVTDKTIKNLGKFLNNTKAKIIVSITDGEDINGYILLGAKRSNKFYSKRDIDFLRSISMSLSGTFSRVIFYEATVARVRREFGNKEN